MKLKRWEIVLYILATVIIIALLVIFRRYVLPDSINDKIDDMTANKNSDNATKVYNAGYAHLVAHFGDTQAKILAALMVYQSKVESSNYTSAVFKRTNNCFGYKYIGSKYQTAKDAPKSPEGDNYGCYASIDDCAREIADYIVRHDKGVNGYADFKNVKSVEDYANALKQLGYYGEAASDYATDMNYYRNQSKNQA